MIARYINWMYRFEMCVKYYVNYPNSIQILGHGLHIKLHHISSYLHVLFCPSHALLYCNQSISTYPLHSTASRRFSSPVHPVNISSTRRLSRPVLYVHPPVFFHCLALASSRRLQSPPSHFITFHHSDTAGPMKNTSHINNIILAAHSTTTQKILIKFQFTGYKMSRPLCRSRLTGLEVEDSLCDATMRPEPTVISCNTHMCPPK